MSRLALMICLCVLVPLPVSGELTPTYLGSWETGGRAPTDIAVDESGNVYVVSFAWVTKHSSTGSLVWLNDQFGQDVVSISVRGDSLVLVKLTNGRETLRLSPDTGEVLQTLSLGGDHVVHAGNGSVYIDDVFEPKVRRFSLNGELEVQWGAYGTGPGFFSGGPNDVAESATGTILTTEHNAAGGRLQEFTSDGLFIRQAPIPLTITDPPRPYGIGTDPTTGWIFVTDIALHRIYVFDGNLNYIDYIGGQPSSLPGFFLRPYAVAVSHTGVFYVADYGNARVQYFSLGSLPVATTRTTWGRIKTLYE